MVILNVGLRVIAFAFVGHRVHLRQAPATAAPIIAAALFVAGAALVARTL